MALALSVVLGTAALLWGADWLARWGAESLLARNVQQATGISDRPSVDLHGTFFLPQVVRGRYDQVEITVRGLESGPLRIEQVHAELSGVHLSFHDLLVQDTDTVLVERSEETALLSYADLDHYLAATGRRLSLAGEADGEVRVTGTVRVLGQTVSASAAVELSTDGSDLVVRPSSLETGTPLDAASRLLLGQRLSFVVPLDPLPFGQQLAGVRATPDHLVVRAHGRNVLVRP